MHKFSNLVSSFGLMALSACCTPDVEEKSKNDSGNAPAICTLGGNSFTQIRNASDGRITSEFAPAATLMSRRGVLEGPAVNYDIFGFRKQEESYLIVGKSDCLLNGVSYPIVEKAQIPHSWARQLDK